MGRSETLVKELLNDRLQEVRSFFGENFEDTEKCLSHLEREVIAFSQCLDMMDYAIGKIDRKSSEHYQFIWDKNSIFITVDIQIANEKPQSWEPYLVEYLIKVEHQNIPIWKEKFTTDTVKVLGLLLLFKRFLHQ